MTIGEFFIALVALAVLFCWAMSDPEDDDGKD